MDRTLTPEIIDFLPPDDPHARNSRRDLRTINRVMRNAAWWRTVVAPALSERARILELGPGDAGFRPFGDRPVDGLDRMPRPHDWPECARWHQAAAQSFHDWTDYHAIIGNLVFHHFSPRELREIGGKITAHARVIAACEPRRSRRFAHGFSLLGVLIRADRITHHDARASIAAGFRAHELPDALGLDPTRWEIHVDETLLGAYRMLAIRTDDAAR